MIIYLNNNINIMKNKNTKWESHRLFMIMALVLMTLAFYVMIKWETHADYNNNQLWSILNEWDTWWTFYADIDDSLEQDYKNTIYCNSVTGKCHINYKLYSKTYKLPVHSELFKMHIEEVFMMSPYKLKKDLTPVQQTIFLNILLIKKWLKPIYIY